ncbi:hypothetical protein KKA39_03275 [Patescibacteria group bacterium]|nr:hypothetical protein [Patescibacteria group bacterium]MBU1728297.1 hypothetical protein [Patescibacteria group bacterium]
MRKLIHKLRQKPEEERRHLLHIFTAVAAIIMIILWIYSLGRSLASPETKEKVRQDLKPFSVLKDNIVGGYKSITE